MVRELKVDPNFFHAAFSVWLIYGWAFEMQPEHTTFFWNIIIQLTSHDDLTEKLVALLVSLAKAPIYYDSREKNS